MTKEEIYDAEIAPRLAEVAKICKKHDMSLVAQVEYEPGCTGQTGIGASTRSFQQDLVAAAIESHGNLDELIGWVIKVAKVNGHGSMYLKLLGIPEKPS